MDRSKPLLIYDGDCGFCLRWIRRWDDITDGRVDYAPYQAVASQFPSVSPQEFSSSVQLVDVDGRVYRGAEAVFRSLAVIPGNAFILGLYLQFSAVRHITEAFYKLVAKRRALFSALTNFFWGPDVRRSSYSKSISLFVKVVAFIYLIAFASLGIQILGLAGTHGIFPAHDYFEAVRKSHGNGSFWQMPSLFWLNPSDGFLLFLCWVGAAFAFIALTGVIPQIFLMLCWIFYLSLFYAGGPFLSFQWDLLLLETGFLAMFMVPQNQRGSGAMRFLVKLLLFKLMFFSGYVKWMSHDPTWRSFTALEYHFQTQPLPAWTSWYLHHLPHEVLKWMTMGVFFFEILVPFLIFFPRRLRHIGATLLIVFQVLIFVSGNYTFFNLLTVAMCVLLLDDTIWPPNIPMPALRSVLPSVVIYAVSAFILFSYFSKNNPLAPLRVVNSYGVFAVMTTERPEIIIEGSNDGADWRPYEFRFKPGDLNRRPEFVEPHQPRLDWQMWFAALSNWQRNRWFIYFCRRILEGSPEVLHLLKTNPFPDSPPKYLRALVYNYTFTAVDEKKAHGVWWNRELKKPYCPVMSLDNA